MEKTTLHGERNGFNLQDAINKLLAENDTATLEQIPAVFVDEAWGDDESYESKGRAMLEAYLKGDVDGFCIALTGWSFENILKRAGAIEDYDQTFHQKGRDEE